MTAPQNAWMRASEELADLRRHHSDGTPVPSNELLVEALRLLLWLCSERAAPPHRIAPGPRGSVQFRWDQGGSWFEIEATAPGRSTWNAMGPDGAIQSGKVDQKAAETLQSLIPIAPRYRRLSGQSPQPARQLIGVVRRTA